MISEQPSDEFTSSLESSDKSLTSTENGILDGTDATGVPSISIQKSSLEGKNIEAFGDAEKTEIQVTEIESLRPPVNGPGGDAGLVMPVLSPRKSPKPPARAYRMVCQCGAKNCRKFVF